MHRGASLFARSSGLLCLSFVLATPGFSQVVAEAKEERGIQDNSFLIEEAYNQDIGVVQHISTFTRMWNSKDWNFTFTEEWPMPHNPRHQISYSLVGMHSGDFGSSGGGWGDTILNYRYQVAGDGDSRFAFAPRLSVMIPSGDVAEGRGAGGTGVQLNLPFSVVLNRRLVTHWNAGSTFVPHAQSPDHEHAATAGFNLGQSFIVLVHSRFNFLVETSYNRFQSVVGSDRTEWDEALFVNPGIRWSFHLSRGLQIVPGVAIPIGIGSSAGERGLFLYLSFEHPFRKQPAPAAAAQPSSHL